MQAAIRRPDTEEPLRPTIGADGRPVQPRMLDHLVDLWGRAVSALCLLCVVIIWGECAWGFRV